MPDKTEPRPFFKAAEFLIFIFSAHNFATINSAFMNVCALMNIIKSSTCMVVSLSIHSSWKFLPTCNHAGRQVNRILLTNEQSNYKISTPSNVFACPTLQHPIISTSIYQLQSEIENPIMKNTRFMNLKKRLVKHLNYEPNHWQMKICYNLQLDSRGRKWDNDICPATNLKRKNLVMQQLGKKSLGKLKFPNIFANMICFIIETS